MSNWLPGASIEVLRQRSTLLKKIRQYFDLQKILEVDTPSISKYPTVDEHLEPIKVALKENQPTHFLITSPEYHMKRLLSFGMPSIYQICKAFRADELGAFHNPEFTIIEWYQLGFDDQKLMQSVDKFLQFTIDSQPADFISYQNLFKSILEIDPLKLTHSIFITCCKERGFDPPQYLLDDYSNTDDQLNFLMGYYIENQIGLEKPVFVYNYPASQSALAKIHPKQSDVSQRFEVFYKGMELGNGYHELQEYQEHLNRFETTIKNRNDQLKIDLNFMQAIENGLPQCAGIAMGFDRLLMIKTQINNIDEVLSFSSKRC